MGRWSIGILVSFSKSKRLKVKGVDKLFAIINLLELPGYVEIVRK